jgi:Tol biopolymer transport system component/DNA-binding winged helix-turn-helix (wHTH) protein
MGSQINRNPSRKRAFGPFVFDEASGELWKHDVRVRLQGQPLHILQTLIRVPGAIVTRDEFQQILWGGSTFVDFDHGLHAAMNRLRQVLGDSADQPRYIETLPGRGYRFIAPVQDSDTKPVLVMPSSPESPPPGLSVPPSTPSSFAVRPAPKRRWFLWLIGGAAASGLVSAYLAGVRPSGRGPTVRFSVSPPAGYALEAGSSRQTFALSPDGSRLAFTAFNASANSQLFLRDLNAVDARPLPNSSGAFHVFWAPDSRSLFLTMSGQVRRYPLEAESYQVVCDTPAIMLTGAMLGPDVLISTRLANFVVSSSGGTPRAVKERFPWPHVLPDGKHVLYTARDRAARHHTARVVEWGKPETAKDLLETDSRAMYTPSTIKPGSGYLVYARAGNLLAHPFDPESLRIQGEPLVIASRIYSFFPTGAADFSVSSNGLLAYRRYMSRSQLAWVNRGGEVLKRIGPENVNLKYARLSPDGRKVVTSIFNVDRGVNEIWIIDLDTGADRQAFIVEGQVDCPVWSPDSATLLFQRALEGPPKLFLRSIGVSASLEPLPEGFFQIPTDWSSDGRFIAFTNTSFGETEKELRGDVWLIDMARGRKIVPLISTPFHESNPVFSPDGRWLAFTSNETGRAELYIQSFEADNTPHLAGERYLVSRQGAASLRWRRDGKELFYLAGDGRIYGVPITLLSKPKIGKPVPLVTISTEARAAIHSLAGFDVSVDGQQFLIPIVTSAEKSEIVVVQNWEPEIQRSIGRFR